MEKESQKKENELKKGEINNGTETDEISERNEVGEVKIDDRVKEKQDKAL